MRVAIIDDEQYFLDHVHSMLRKTMNIYGIGDFSVDLFHSKDEFLKSFSPNTYDMLIVDIFIDKDNGVDLAREVRKLDDTCVIIFCTTSNEFAHESYRVRASYYLVKPIVLEDMVEMFNHIDILGLENRRTVVFPDSFGCRINDIFYTEYYNHKVTIYLSQGQVHGIHMSQKEIEEILSPITGFFVLNRGCIVNLDKVNRVEDQSVVLEDGTHLAVTRNRIKLVKTLLLDFRVRKM